MEEFILKVSNPLIPLDTLQWRAYVVLNYKNTNKTLILNKIHHSIADGSSALCMNMCLSGSYDKNQLMQYRVGFRQRCLAMLTMLTYLQKKPSMTHHLLKIFRDQNVLKERQYASTSPPEYGVCLS